MSNRNINKLVQPFQDSIKKLIKQAEEAGLNPLVTDVSRTPAQQQELFDDGLSFTLKSKHLIGEAVDIAFTSLPGGKGGLLYDAKLYKRLYKLAKDIPFVIWPYKDLGWNWDKPHFQYDKTKKIVDNEDMYKEKYEQEVGNHKESIARGNSHYKNWQHELDLRKHFENRNTTNYDHWQNEIEARHKVEDKLKKCKEGTSLLDKIKALLG